MARNSKIFSIASRAGLPSWAANLIGFFLLILVVLALFFWQLTATRNTLQRNAINRSAMVLSIIEENVSNAAMASSTIDALMASFLGDKARFVAYLDAIDPLLPDELEALAKETGLHAITLTRPNGILLNPQNWHDAGKRCPQGTQHIEYLNEKEIGVLTYTEQDNPDISCITIAIDASPILALQKKTALPILLKTLSSLPGFNYVRLETDNKLTPADQRVKLVRKGERYTAEAKVLTDQGVLVVGLNASNFVKRREQLTNQFIIFSSLLLCLGIFFSWLLYRYQLADVEQTRHYEQMLAREHEAAALGRATATIAHEIRNPLNAINLGLQRLPESDNLDEEQEALVEAMEKAVKRTASIVTELQRFCRPLQPERTELQLHRIIDQLLPLYTPLCSRQNLTVQTEYFQEDTVLGDRDLLTELFENLLKNSIEAQPDTGFITLRTARQGPMIIVEWCNGGFSLPEDLIPKLGEPYFTTKTRGTGLGLALCRRIAEAHGGSLQTLVDQQLQTLTARVVLPAAQAGPQE